MAYRRTYRDFEVPYSDELTFDLEFIDSEAAEIAAHIMFQDPLEGYSGEEEGYISLSNIYKALMTNWERERDDQYRRVQSNEYPEYLVMLYKFSQAITASGVNKEFCPHMDRVMVRYYGPADARKAEKFLEEQGFIFDVESDG